jgi:hypothetical protein
MESSSRRFDAQSQSGKFSSKTAILKWREAAARVGDLPATTMRRRGLPAATSRYGMSYHYQSGKPYPLPSGAKNGE